MKSVPAACPLLKAVATALFLAQSAAMMEIRSPGQSCQPTPERKGDDAP